MDQIGVHPDPSHMQAIAHWTMPIDMHIIKRFMGGINFYRKFVSHFSQMAHPLH
jgi:hypothetical protein